VEHRGRAARARLTNCRTLEYPPPTRPALDDMRQLGAESSCVWKWGQMIGIYPPRKEEMRLPRISSVPPDNLKAPVSALFRIFVLGICQVLLLGLSLTIAHFSSDFISHQESPLAPYIPALNPLKTVQRQIFRGSGDFRHLLHCSAERLDRFTRIRCHHQPSKLLETLGWDHREKSRFFVPRSRSRAPGYHTDRGGPLRP
jgi:hypothetical protein